MQDLYAERMQLFDRLMDELKQRRDCSEALYKASQEAINVYKLKIRTVDEDIKRTWSNGTGEGSY